MIGLVKTCGPGPRGNPGVQGHAPLPGHPDWPKIAVTALSLAAARFTIRPRIVVGHPNWRTDDGFDGASRTPRGRRDITVLRFDNPPCRLVAIQTCQHAGRHLAI